jgi:hypothetical protein
VERWRDIGTEEESASGGFIWTGTSPTAPTISVSDLYTSFGF